MSPKGGKRRLRTLSSLLLGREAACIPVETNSLCIIGTQSDRYDEGASSFVTTRKALSTGVPGCEKIALPLLREDTSSTQAG